MSSFRDSAVVGWRQSVSAAVFGAVMALAAPASAEDDAGRLKLVHPQIGFGGGAIAVGEGAGGAFQLDFSLGAERASSFGDRGLLLKSDLLFAGDASASGGFQMFRTDLALLATLSTHTSDFGKPFARIGAGPLLSFTSINGRASERGVGFQAEAAAGFKNIAEVYTDARTSADSFGPATAFTGGLRFHALLVLYALAEGY